MNLSEATSIGSEVVENGSFSGISGPAVSVSKSKAENVSSGSEIVEKNSSPEAADTSVSSSVTIAERKGLPAETEVKSSGSEIVEYGSGVAMTVAGEAAKAKGSEVVGSMLIEVGNSLVLRSEAAAKGSVDVDEVNWSDVDVSAAGKAGKSATGDAAKKSVDGVAKPLLDSNRSLVADAKSSAPGDEMANGSLTGADNPATNEPDVLVACPRVLLNGSVEDDASSFAGPNRSAEVLGMPGETGNRSAVGLANPLLVTAKGSVVGVVRPLLTGVKGSDVDAANGSDVELIRSGVKKGREVVSGLVGVTANGSND